MRFRDLAVGDKFKFISGLPCKKIDFDQYLLNDERYVVDINLFDKPVIQLVSFKDIPLNGYFTYMGNSFYKLTDYSAKRINSSKPLMRMFTSEDIVEFCDDHFMTYNGIPKDVVAYCKNDVIDTKELCEYHGNWCKFTPKKVIFSNPATIVLWWDDTKTVVKCSPNDTYDKEKGLALCYMKKLLGNDNRFHKKFKQYIIEED